MQSILGKPTVNIGRKKRIAQFTVATLLFAFIVIGVGLLAFRCLSMATDPRVFKFNVWVLAHCVILAYPVMFMIAFKLGKGSR